MASRPALLAVVVLLSASGYLVTSRTIDGDRRSAADRSAQATSVRTQAVLGLARAAVGRGLLTVDVGLDPKRVAISANGRRLEGEIRSAAAGVSFEALAQTWRIAVGTEPASGLQSLLPWFALAWPMGAALIVSLVASWKARRRKAERYAKMIFDHSPDLLCIAGLDGYFKRVNPAVVRTLGFSEEELLSRPCLDFVHPDDLQRSIEVVEALARGEEIVEFENRTICRDGSFRWLQWDTQPLPEEGLLFCAARDVTDRRRAEDELRQAQRMVEASRDELRLLAEEQAALRRVATLVCSGAEPADVFAAVAEEARGVLGADATNMVRLDPDDQATVVGRAGARPGGLPLNLEELYAMAAVLRTGRPARRDGQTDAPGPVADMLPEGGMRSAVATPIVVDGRLWGALAITSGTGELPADTEPRMVAFTELIGTAIANTESWAQLLASRARVVAAADETRRRIERDLHDGTQQQLIALTLALRAAEADVPLELADLRAAVGRTAGGLARATEDLQAISRGIHPAILSQGGIGPALRALGRRAGLPVKLCLNGPERLPERAEVAAYYVVSEALSNAAKHARASMVRVGLNVEHAVVEVSIRDDGVGGADPDRGSGLVGLRDRVEALGGTIETTSPPGQGTCILARIPLDSDAPTAWPAGAALPTSNAATA